MKIASSSAVGCPIGTPFGLLESYGPGGDYGIKFFEKGSPNKFVQRVELAHYGMDPAAKFLGYRTFCTKVVGIVTSYPTLKKAAKNSKGRLRYDDLKMTHFSIQSMDIVVLAIGRLEPELDQQVRSLIRRLSAGV